jgi:hypothetical protein
MGEDDGGEDVVAGRKLRLPSGIVEQLNARKADADAAAPTPHLEAPRAPARGLVGEHRQTDDGAPVAVVDAVGVDEHPLGEAALGLPLHLDVPMDGAVGAGGKLWERRCAARFGGCFALERLYWIAGVTVRRRRSQCIAPLAQAHASGAAVAVGSCGAQLGGGCGAAAGDVSVPESRRFRSASSKPFLASLPPRGRSPRRRAHRGMAKLRHHQS